MVVPTRIRAPAQYRVFGGQTAADMDATLRLAPAIFFDVCRQVLAQMMPLD